MRHPKDNELILDGDMGSILFRIKPTGDLEIEMFDQRTIIDVFTKEDINILAKWLFSQII